MKNEYHLAASEPSPGVNLWEVFCPGWSHSPPGESPTLDTTAPPPEYLTLRLLPLHLWGHLMLRILCAAACCRHASMRTPGRGLT